MKTRKATAEELAQAKQDALEAGDAIERREAELTELVALIAQLKKAHKRALRIQLTERVEVSNEAG